MFLTLVVKELRGHVLNLRYQVAVGLTLVLVVSCVLACARGYAREVEAWRAEEREFDEVRSQDFTLSEILDKSFGFRRPPEPLGVVCYGLASAMSRPVRLEVSVWRGQPLSLGSPAEAEPVLAFFQRPDLAYVVAAVVSFLALLFVYDAVCGEKEDGTLRLILSSPVPRDLVLFAKWGAAFLAMAAPLALSVAVGVGLAPLAAPLGLGAAAWLRVGLFTALALLYLALFLSAGLAVSSLTHRPATSLVVCLFLWILLVLALPALGSQVARVLRPVETVKHTEARKQAKAEEVRDRGFRRVEGGGRMAEWADYMRIREEIKRETRQIDRARRARLLEQARLARNLARASPAAAFLHAAGELSGTGLESWTEHVESVDRLNDRFTGEVERIAMELFATRGHEAMNEPIQADLLPRLEVATPALRQALAAALPDAVALVAGNALAFLTALVAFLRYDPR